MVGKTAEVLQRLVSEEFIEFVFKDSKSGEKKQIAIDVFVLQDYSEDLKDIESSTSKILLLFCWIYFTHTGKEAFYTITANKKIQTHHILEKKKKKTFFTYFNILTYA